ncbi:MAG: nucleotide exchange factor GrpE [Clostridia bacterium]|nr:nucleotide exchange factor GrpE [Clostridia bacterium]
MTKNKQKVQKEEKKEEKVEEQNTEINETNETNDSINTENTQEVKEEETNVTPSKEQEYLLLAQKTQAEFENYKKRTLKAEIEAKQKGIIEAVNKFLPVIDAFDIAQKQETNTEYIKTNSVIINQLKKALEDLGVSKIEALNKPFDYNLHNAIMVDTVEGIENDIVLEVFQEGYVLKDKVIRHSIVKVNKK